MGELVLLLLFAGVVACVAIVAAAVVVGVLLHRALDRASLLYVSPAKPDRLAHAVSHPDAALAAELELEQRYLERLAPGSGPSRSDADAQGVPFPSAERVHALYGAQAAANDARRKTCLPCERLRALARVLRPWPFK